MKVGDLIMVKPEKGWKLDDVGKIGTVLEFPVPTHPKQFQKVRVLCEGREEDWIMQFCEIVNESR